MPEAGSGPRPTVVVGGGWSGLAAAVELCRHRQPVLLLESARQLGGRARSVRFDDTVLDNGQHLMIGAYRTLLTLMNNIGVAPEDCFERLPLTLRMLKGGVTSLSLRTPRLPAPLHLLAGILTARGLSIAERLAAIRFGRRMLRMSLDAAEDISVQALLHSEAQGHGLVRKLWEPLCIAALNTPIELASARLFTEVLKASFADLNRHSDLLIPKTELSAILPNPAASFIEQHGGSVCLGQRVSALVTTNNRIRAVRVGDRTIRASRVILATSHPVARRLLSHHEAALQTVRKLAELGHEPISTLYLQYPTDIRLPVAMLGLEDTLAQWVFDRRLCGQPGLMAVVISARGEHPHMPADDLVERVTRELAECFPHWPAPLSQRLVREKRATFCAGVGIDSLRPGNRTPLAGLWLAGDYTDTGLPATLEGAVTSGIKCASAILQESPD